MGFYRPDALHEIIRVYAVYYIVFGKQTMNLLIGINMCWWITLDGSLLTYQSSNIYILWFYINLKQNIVCFDFRHDRHHIIIIICEFIRFTMSTCRLNLRRHISWVSKISLYCKCWTLLLCIFVYLWCQLVVVCCLLCETSDTGHQRGAVDSWTVNGCSSFFPSNYSSMLAGSAAHFGSMPAPAFSVHNAREPPMVRDSD